MRRTASSTGKTERCTALSSPVSDFDLCHGYELHYRWFGGSSVRYEGSLLPRFHSASVEAIQTRGPAGTRGGVEPGLTGLPGGTATQRHVFTYLFPLRGRTRGRRQRKRTRNVHNCPFDVIYHNTTYGGTLASALPMVLYDGGVACFRPSLQVLCKRPSEHSSVAFRVGRTRTCFPFVKAAGGPR